MEIIVQFLMAFRHGLMLLWFTDLMNVKEESYNL